MKKTDVIIIGAGVSGITAAIYLKRAGVDFILIEKYMPGGKIALTSTIENYPGYKKIDGFELALKLQEQLTFNQIAITYENITSIKKDKNIFTLKGNNEEYQSSFVILATGTKEKTLNIKDEEKFISKGISMCAICDGALYKNQEVAVLGGGNSALEESLYLSSICKKVYLIHRRNEFRGDDILLNKIRESKNIEILTPYNVVEYFGEKNLNAVKLKNIDDNKEIKIDIKALFLYIGSEPTYPNLEFDISNENGYIITDDNMMSSIEGLYVIGDVRKKILRQIITASSDGASAAIAIEKKMNRM